MKTIVFSVTYYKKDAPHNTLINTKVFIDSIYEDQAILKVIDAFRINNHIVTSVSFIASEIHERILN